MNHADVDALKHGCPMPLLMERIGLGEFAKPSCRSPFREDKNPSWGIFQRDGNWFFKDQATGDHGDEIALLARWKGLDEKGNFQAILKIYSDLAGVSLNGAMRPNYASFEWSPCVRAFGPKETARLVEWRCYSAEFCDWLKAENMIGLYEKKLALPVHGEGGAVVGVHYRWRDGHWGYAPKGIAVRPMIFGNPGQAANVFVFESPWDAFALMDKLGWHRPKGIPDTAIVITRGAGNGKLIAGLVTATTLVYAFKQNDETKKGKNAANEWMDNISDYAGCRVLRAETPAQFKDLNDWTRAGATVEDLLAAIQDAKLVSSPVSSGEELASNQGVEIVENSQEQCDAGSHSTFSTFSTANLSVDAAIYPENSWFERYMEFARAREESADSYLIGSILPVVAAALARRVKFPWGEGRIYPNLFAMIAGKPGDRKSSAITLAEKVARIVLEENTFLPDQFSVEAMFDDYDVERGGSPDKLLIADDANPFLGMLQKSNYGERVGDQLLRLFDCKGLSESFRRNKPKGDAEAEARRYIEETSTSIVFGATFNNCQFQGQAIRSGLQRRFSYYLADRHGRFLSMPAAGDQMHLLAITEKLAKLVSLQETESQFTPEAKELWNAFQQENRRLLEDTEINRESQLARLNGQPTHALKLAMIFQCALWIESPAQPFSGTIEEPTLRKAIEHSNHCILAAQALDSIGNRAALQGDAEVLLAKITSDFRHKLAGGWIHLTRTDLTSTYAHHSGRKGAWTPNDLYNQLIPHLVHRGKAREIARTGKRPAFQFKVEEGA